MKRSIPVLLAAALCLTTLVAPARASAALPGEDVLQSAAQYQFGQSRKALATIEEALRAATPAEYKAIEARLLAVMKAPGTTSDAKRHFCRYLGIVGSAQSVPALAALLADEKLSHPARMALEVMPDPAAGAALRQALGRVKGKWLAGVIGSVGVRRDTQAVAALAPLTGDADGDVARSALFALGAIGTPEAAKALDAAAAKAPDALRRPAAQAQLVCAGALAQAGKTAEAAAIYQSLAENKAAPAVQVAAVRGLIATQARPEAVTLIAQRLQGDDAAMRAATLSAFIASPDPALKAAVVEQLPAMNPAAQKAILGLLPDLRDVPARAGLLKLIQESQDEATRVAALECLVTHGQADDVAMLVKLAQAGPGAASAAARTVLDRMPGTGVNEAIARLLESTDAPTRSLALALVTGRRIGAALPVLVKMSAGTDAAAAAEAVKALAALGTPAELPGLVKILMATSDGGLRTAVEGAASSICTRATDREACGQALIPALDSSAAPAARIAILGLLPRVKTTAALAAAQKVLAQEADAGVRQAALRALADWPDLTAAPVLLAAAKAPKGPTDAVVALRGCLRLAGFKDQPVAERLSMYRSILELAARPDEKKQALAGLADLPSPGALALLTKYLSDPALAADAAQATLRLVKQVGVAYRPQAEAALNQLKAQPGLAPELKAQADDAMKGLSGATLTSGGVILAWMLSGPYTQEGKSGAELFDVAFPPEKTGGGEWRVITVPANAATPGLVELNVILGGNERVAYLRTQVTTTKAQDAVLECGSDDGIRVWLNGQQVHANNTTRPCGPGEDKVKLKLKQGANTLLLKVTQGAGEWAAIARLVGPDGKPLDATVAPQ